MHAAIAPTLTAKEIAGLMNVHKTSIMRRAARERWPVIDANGKGGRVKRYIFSGLPEEIRLLAAPLYNNKDTRGAETARAGEPDPLSTGGSSLTTPAGVPAPAGPTLSGQPACPTSGETDSLFPTPVVSAAPTARVICPGLAAWQNDIAVARYDLVTAYIAAKAAAKRRGLSVCAAAADFVASYNTGIPYPAIFSIVKTVARPTLDKWHHAIKNANHAPAAIAPQYGRHRKGRRVVTPAEFNKALEFALQPNGLRISQVIRWTKKVLKDEGIPSPSSEATIRRALLDWKDANLDRWIFCREGEKALADKVLPFLERDDSLLEVGDCLVADGHTLNFRVINPYTGRPCRPTILMFLDWASRFPAGWYIMLSENVQCIHAALRRAILALGKIPKWVLIDNGKAFKAKHFKQKDLDFEQAGFQGLYARLGMNTYFAAPYNAKTKPVERFFGTFNELERLAPSYSGRSIEDKPAYLRRNERLHKQLHNEFVPTIEQADTAIRAWAWGEYAARPHRGIRGKTPASIWEAGKGPGVPEDGLRYLMMSCGIKTIGRNGVTLFGINYYDEALYGYRKPVMVRHDILDLERVYIYSEDGSEFICEASPRRSVHPIARMTGNPIDLEAVREGLREQRRLKRSTEAEARAIAAQLGPGIFPEGAASGPRLLDQDPLPMTPAQIAAIEEQAAATEVIHLDEVRQPDLATWEGETYERLIEKRAKGGELTAGEQLLMTEFEQTDAYRLLKDHYRSLEENWIMAEEAAQ